MFDLKPQRAVTNDPRVIQFCEVYTKFIKGTEWIKQQEAAGANTYNDRVAFFRKVVTPMDGMWEKLPQNLRKEAAYRLVDKGVLPEVLAKALEVFDGDVVALK